MCRDARTLVAPQRAAEPPLTIHRGTRPGPPHTHKNPAGRPPSGRTGRLCSGYAAAACSMTVLTEEMILAKTRCSDIERVRNLNMFGSELEDVRILKVWERTDGGSLLRVLALARVRSRLTPPRGHASRGCPTSRSCRCRTTKSRRCGRFRTAASCRSSTCAKTRSAHAHKASVHALVCAWVRGCCAAMLLAS